MSKAALSHKGGQWIHGMWKVNGWRHLPSDKTWIGNGGVNRVNMPLCIVHSFILRVEAWCKALLN